MIRRSQTQVTGIAMKTKLPTILYSFMCLWVATCTAAFPPDKENRSECIAALTNCREGATDDQINSAYKYFDTGGYKTVLLLSECMDITDMASAKHFQGAYVDINPKTGDITPRLPTLGDVAFSVIVQRIEGVRPDHFRDSYVLTRENIGKWIRDRKGASIHQLQVQAAEEALKITELNHKKKPSAHSENLVWFLKKNLAMIASGQEPQHSRMLDSSK